MKELEFVLGVVILFWLIGVLIFFVNDVIRYARNEDDIRNIMDFAARDFPKPLATAAVMLAFLMLAFIWPYEVAKGRI